MSWMGHLIELSNFISRQGSGEQQELVHTAIEVPDRESWFVPFGESPIAQRRIADANVGDQVLFRNCFLTQHFAVEIMSDLAIRPVIDAGNH